MPKITSQQPPHNKRNITGNTEKPTNTDQPTDTNRPTTFGEPNAPTTPRDPRKAIGDAGEGIAAAYLERSGYRIVARNWRRRGGELDIVAADGPVLAFIEVRTRTSRAYGSGEESVDLRKQRQVRKVAALFLAEAGALPQRSFRFDVLVVDLDRRTGEVRDVRHLRNAF